MAVIGVNTAGSIYEMKSQFWRTEVTNETLTSFIIESIDSKTDIAIIGSGISSKLAALALAKDTRKVAIYGDENSKKSSDIVWGIFKESRVFEIKVSSISIPKISFIKFLLNLIKGFLVKSVESFWISE